MKPLFEQDDDNKKRGIYTTADAIEITGTDEELQASVLEALEDQLIGQRLVGIELHKEVVGTLNNGAVPITDLTLAVMFDNDKAYIMRCRCIIKELAEAIGNKDTSDEASGQAA